MQSKVVRRNTKSIGFNDAEYAEIKQAAEKEGLFPRQLILIKIRGKHV